MRSIDDVDNTEDYYDDDDTEIKNTSKAEDEVEEEVESLQDLKLLQETQRQAVILYKKELEVTMIRPTSVEESRIVVDNLKGVVSGVLNLWRM